MALNKEMEQRQSKVIDTMRFPLIVLVLFIHMVPFKGTPFKWEFSEINLYHILSETLSHNIGEIAVPYFFLFSGFFFFRKMEEWNKKFYLQQLKKRIRTLVIPYFLWNAILILVIWIKNYAFHFIGSGYDESFGMIRNNSVYALLWSIPVDFPLWFLRDLICMTILAPGFYFLFRYIKIYGLLLLAAVYLSGLGNNIPGLSITAFMFFGTGAFLGIYKKNLLEICSKFKYPGIAGAVFFLCLAMVYNATDYHIYFVRFFVIFGMITAINAMNYLSVKNKKIIKRLCKLSPSVFFIYAVHEIYIINWLKGAFSRTPLAHSGIGLLTGYLSIPFICLGICLGLYFMLRKICPKLLSFSVGGRISHIDGYVKNNIAQKKIKE